MTGLIADSEFDINRTEEYKLSIQISLDGFSFSVIHIEQKKLLALESYKAKLSSGNLLGRHVKEWLDSKQILQKNFGIYNLICHSEKLTFIPSPYYEYNLQEVTGNLVMGKNADYKFIDYYLDNDNGNLIFPVSSKVLEILKSTYPEKPVKHPLAILYEAIQKQPKLNGNTLIACFNSQCFCMMIFNDEKILLVNSFDYKDSGDILFYILTAMNSLKILSRNTTLYMAGEISPLSKFYSNSVKFFGKSYFMVPDIVYNNSIFKEPLYRHIILF